MANLISFKQSFIWEDPTVFTDGEFISQLNEALVNARANGDSIFAIPGLKNIILSWGDFIDFIYYFAFEEEERRKKFPWMTEKQHTTLINIFRFFNSETPEFATDLTSLEREYPKANNCYIGFEYALKPIKYICNKDSWFNFHRVYVTDMTYSERCTNFKYFIKFFQYGLTVKPNQIEHVIKKKRVNPLFKRLDTPKQVDDDSTLHHEIVQMHFNDKSGSALNIDGTWKHGKFNLPNDVCETLSYWGFLLPPEYYK